MSQTLFTLSLDGTGLLGPVCNVVEVPLACTQTVP